jgi:hypothetical protein
MVTDWIQAVAASAQAAAVVAGAFWGLREVKRYRQKMHIIQLDIDAHLYRLSSPLIAEAPTWERGQRQPTTLPARPYPFAVEVLLTFRNKGRTRFRLYNAMIGFNTLRPADQKVVFTSDDGHLHLTRLITTGNIVPKFKAPDLPVERKIDKTSFFYIEPGVDQVISFVTLLPEINQLLQIDGSFSLEQERIFPARLRGENRLFPHNVARTYQVVEGRLVGRD